MQRHDRLRQRRADRREQRSGDAFGNFEAFAEMFERVGEELGRHQNDDQHNGEFDEQTRHARPPAYGKTRRRGAWAARGDWVGDNGGSQRQLRGRT